MVVEEKMLSKALHKATLLGFCIKLNCKDVAWKWDRGQEIKQEVRKGMWQTCACASYHTCTCSVSWKVCSEGPCPCSMAQWSYHTCTHSASWRVCGEGPYPCSMAQWSYRTCTHSASWRVCGEGPCPCFMAQCYHCLTPPPNAPPQPGITMTQC